MATCDEAILRDLHTEGIAYIPLVASRCGLHVKYAEARVEVLETNRLLERVSQEPVYRITKLGERYLAGDVAPADLVDRR